MGIEEKLCVQSHEVKPYLEGFEAKVKAWEDGGREAGATDQYEAAIKQTLHSLARGKSWDLSQ